MPADKDRYRTYRRELLDLLEGLSAPERFRALDAKVVDYLARRGVDPDDTLRLRRALRELLGEELSVYADELLRSYQDTLEIVNANYQDLGVDITREATRVRAIEEATRFELGRYQDSVIQDIEQAVRRGVLQGDSVQDLAARIAPASKKAAFYAETIAKTQIKAVGRVAKTEKARQAEVLMYEYVGIIRSTTRPFCRAMVGQTMHIDDIRSLKNGNREPVITFCGGWNCIHDWEPDPFAEVDRSFEPQEREGGRIIIPKGDRAKKRFDQAVSYRQLRQLQDPEAFVSRASEAAFNDDTLRKKVGKHADFASLEEARAFVESARQSPDETFYQFHAGRSTIVFRKGEHFIFATDREGKSVYKPASDGYEQFTKNVVPYWIKLD